MKKKKHLQIFFPLIRHTLLLSNLWKYLYKCNTRDDLEKDQTWQRIRSEVTRARTHMLCVCVCKRERAWRPSFCARARDLCHRRASGESGRERGAVRRQKKYHKGGQAPWYVTRGKRPRRRGEGEGGSFFSFFSLTPSLSRVSLLFRDSIADPRNYFCRLPSFDRKARRHRRSRLSTGDDNWTPADLMKIIIFSM